MMKKNRIQEIIELSSEIDLWSIDLPPIPKTRGSKAEFDPFTVEGVLRNYVEFEDEISKIDKLTSFEKILKFAEENGRMPKQSRKKALEMTKEEKKEDSLYNKWFRTEEKKIVDRYAGIDKQEIPEDFRELVQTIRNFGYGLQSGLTPYEEVMKFAEENGRMPKSIKKKASEMTKEEKEEFSLYQKWLRTEEKKILKEYAEQSLENVPEEYREKIAKLRSYGIGINQSKLIQAKNQRDNAKAKNEQSKELEERVSEQLKKRGQAHEEQ